MGGEGGGEGRGGEGGGGEGEGGEGGEGGECEGAGGEKVIRALTVRGHGVSQLCRSQHHNTTCNTWQHNTTCTVTQTLASVSLAVAMRFRSASDSVFGALFEWTLRSVCTHLIPVIIVTIIP